MSMIFEMSEGVDKSVICKALCVSPGHILGAVMEVRFLVANSAICKAFLALIFTMSEFSFFF